MTDTQPHPAPWSSDKHGMTRAESSPHHARMSSTASNATIPENTFDLAQQTEPLLHIPESPSYLEQSLPRPELRQTRTLTAHSPRRGPSSLWEIIVQKRLRLLRAMKYGLEALIAVWAVYNGIRYFYSYSIYTSSQGQAASLALAMSSSTSLASLTCATLLSMFKIPLARNIPPRASHLIRKVLRSISTCLILAPPIFNIVFLFIWRHSSNQELSYAYRCYIDIDVVWSVPKSPCVAPSWSIWLALALLRLVITLTVLVSYHIFSFAYGRTLQLSNTRRLRVMSFYETTETSTHASLKDLALNRNSLKQRRPSHTSQSTSDSNVESTQTVIPRYTVSKARVTRSVSSTSSEDEQLPITTRYPPGLGSSSEESATTRGETLSQFRILIDEDGDMDNIPESPYSFNLPPLLPSVGYNEFGQPYPPEEPLPILNAFIRRMPTIESMGSREMGSIGSSVAPSKEPILSGSARSTPTFDRPPTRPLSRAEIASSATSSRPNSLGLRAGLLANLGGATELGERLDRMSKRGDEEKRVSSPESDKSYVDANNPSTSRSTLSYYTATSGVSTPAGASIP
ncbi:hypothetical protein APHAL10511_007612 [Amanita phalloides]|nr:hypothetical protein APHAL10511_007612 [Amanita phalloides]